jgi:type II secretory pathway component PulL
MSRKVLGIDICKESVSAVLVTTSLRENRIEAHAYIPLVDTDEGEHTFKTALNALCDEIDPGGSDCVVSISADHFSYRILQVPFKDSKKIKMVLPFELEPTVPYPVDDLMIDFIDLRPVGQSDHSEIIAVAVPKAQLNPYIESLAELKIDPEMITVSGLPAAMCLANRADPGKDRLILEVGNASSSLFIVSEGNLQLIRSFPTPLDSETRFGMLGAFVQRTLAAYDELCQTEFQPQDMVVTGAGLNGASLDSDVSKVLDIPVNRLNFADRLNISIDSENTKPWNPALMDNALSLTMMAIEGIKGLNFHKDHFAAKKIFNKYKKYWIKTGILAAVVLALLFFSALTETHTINRKLDIIDQQITGVFKATFPDAKRIVDPHREMQIKVQEAQKSAVNQSTVGPHIRSIDILNSISQSVPNSIKVDVTRMVISPENVLISGNTDDFKSVDDIKGNLEQVAYFKKVTITSSNLNRSDKGVRFQLKVEL